MFPFGGCGVSRGFGVIGLIPMHVCVGNRDGFADDIPLRSQTRMNELARSYPVRNKDATNVTMHVTKGIDVQKK